MNIAQFKEKYGWDCTRADHLKIVIADSIENHDHENMLASNYSLPIRQQIILHEQAIKLAQKNDQKEINETIKAQKVEAKEAAKAAKESAKKSVPKIDMTAEEIEEKLQDLVVNFAAKNKLNKLNLTIMGAKLAAKAMMNETVQSIIPIGIEAYRKCAENDADVEKIAVEAFKESGLTEETLKKAILDFWEELKKDKGMKDVVNLVNKFLDRSNYYAANSLGQHLYKIAIGIHLPSMSNIDG
jgi:hypothetical protein